MPDPIKPPAGTPPDDHKPTLPSEIADIRNKSFREIVKEGQGKAGTPADDEEEKKKREEEEAAKKAEDEKKAADEKAQAETREREAREAQEKHDREVAEKAAADAIAKRDEEERQKKADAEKAKENQDMRKPVWLRDPNWPYKDANGKPVPQSYEQMVEETNRIADLRFKDELDRREREQSERTAAEQRKKEEAEATQKKAQDDFDKQMQTELVSDLNDLYSMDRLPKVINENDPNDPGIIARKNLFDTGIKVNQERVKKGLAPIRSIKVIFYEHYKPVKQPAGADAPIQGGSQPQNDKSDATEFNFARDHKRSLRQVLADTKRAVTGKR